VVTIGYDIGSSSIKAALFDVDNHKVLARVKSPATEMKILAPQKGFAEQEPEIWWQHIANVTQNLLDTSGINKTNVKAIGITYQMHGLVLVDEQQQVLRPSIIWCDSRAVDIGEQIFNSLGQQFCLDNYLNSPGNFTASKLKWVSDNEPGLYKKVHKMMLPGDYIAMKMTGEICTTVAGLSEGVLWNFKEHRLADSLLKHLNLNKQLIPKIKDTFSVQGELTKQAAGFLKLAAGTPVSYRAGDQPNNALSLGVYKPGQVAATAGTSGVIYSVTDQQSHDPQLRVNSFAHVNHSKENPRIGVLLCLNGAGIQYAWVKNQIAHNNSTYQEINKSIDEIPVGANGLYIYPYGNGAERMFLNKDVGAQISNLNFNRHTKHHIFRAALEGIAFSFVYGFSILKNMEADTNIIKVGNDNLFRSKVFSQSIANLLQIPIEIKKTDGAVGAAKASAVGLGLVNSIDELFEKIETESIVEPKSNIEAYSIAYQNWEEGLKNLINNLRNS